MSKVKRCECCGQVIPPDIQFGPVAQRVWEAICERPRTAEQLKIVVWGLDPNGGPENEKTLYVHIWNINQRLADHGLRIQSRRGQPYRLVAA